MKQMRFRKLVLIPVLFVLMVTSGCMLIQVEVSLPMFEVHYQVFSGGMMLWRQDNAVIYVIAHDGRAWELPANEYGLYPENVVPYDYYTTSKPIVSSGFGRVWANYAQIRLALGDPQTSEIQFVSQIHQIRRGIAFIQQPDGRFVFMFGGRWIEVGVNIHVRLGDTDSSPDQSFITVPYPTYPPQANFPPPPAPTWTPTPQH